MGVYSTKYKTGEISILTSEQSMTIYWNQCQIGDELNTKCENEEITNLRK